MVTLIILSIYVNSCSFTPLSVVCDIYFNYVLTINICSPRDFYVDLTTDYISFAAHKAPHTLSNLVRRILELGRIAVFWDLKLCGEQHRVARKFVGFVQTWG